MTYMQSIVEAGQAIGANGASWSAIDAEAVARMRLQNRFLTGLDIARHRRRHAPRHGRL